MSVTFSDYILLVRKRIARGWIPLLRLNHKEKSHNYKLSPLIITESRVHLGDPPFESRRGWGRLEYVREEEEDRVAILG